MSNSIEQHYADGYRDGYASASEKIKAAIAIAAKWGHIDDIARKQWVIDQMIRAMLTEPKKYEQWVLEMNNTDDEFPPWSNGAKPDGA
jgi:hypothetical protein